MLDENMKMTVFIMVKEWLNIGIKNTILVIDMTYWLCITNREDWEIIKKNNIWGVPEKRHKNI